MSSELYDKLFPRYLLWGKDKQPLPEGTIIPPATKAPEYILGWMIRVPGVREIDPDYLRYIICVIWPSWEANNCKPATGDELDCIGYQVPKLRIIGDNYVFLYIARNHHRMMALLKSDKKNFITILKQTVKTLGLPKGSFKPAVNLMWLRWEDNYQYPEADYPCIGQHLWGTRSAAPAVNLGGERSGAISGLAPVSDALGAIIECREPQCDSESEKVEELPVPVHKEGLYFAWYNAVSLCHGVLKVLYDIFLYYLRG
ncbi:hypothetical protein DFP72DRAFT_884653 [Ephemerocybe angulata]|uniref:Uncharacterized protein n=1 Tax=Ephemerocybe angulata TaxID=980116 RepID=A0A8H6I8T2_9AGAR|nr:hypothetical protein DFP72DRAFT_884653 [Tulosesus angulatus]